APESIKTPAEEHIEAPAAGVPQEFVERRPAILGAAYATVDVFDSRPASRLHIPAKLDRLVLGVLISRARARVDRGLHDRPAFTSRARLRNGRPYFNIEASSCTRDAHGVYVDYRTPVSLKL